MARKRKKVKKGGGRQTVAPAALTGLALLLSETPVEAVDLHGHTAAQAEARLVDFFRSRRPDVAGRVIHIVTGRGNRSEGAPVLPGLVRALLDTELSEYVGESAGLPGGGGVVVRLR